MPTARGDLQDLQIYTHAARLAREGMYFASVLKCVGNGTMGRSSDANSPKRSAVGILYPHLVYLRPRPSLCRHFYCREV